MAAPKGNNYNKKWKTPEERQEACKRFCEHLSKGLSVRCWPDADFNTVKSYMAEYPEDFKPAHIEEAQRKGLYMWESKGIQGTFGGIDGFNANSWKFNMTNRYNADWSEKKEVKQTTELTVISDDDLDNEINNLIGGDK